MEKRKNANKPFTVAEGLIGGIVVLLGGFALLCAVLAIYIVRSLAL